MDRIVSVSSMAFDGYPFEQALDELAALGVEYVEPASVDKVFQHLVEADFCDARARAALAWVAMGLPLLGCIADDFTGATDLANTLVRGGIRTIQTIGVPPPGWDGGEADALVVALKSWTVPAAEAVADSLRTLERVALSGPTPGRSLLASYGVLAPHGEDKPWGS